MRARGQHHGDLRPALLAAALDLLAESGAAALTLRAVARRAGVSPAAPYHHFADKAALLDAVALDGFRQLARVQAAVPAADPLERVAALTAAYVRFALAHRAHYAVMIAALRQTAGAPRGATEDVASAALATFEVLAHAVAEAGADADDARRLAMLVWSQAHGAVSLADVGREMEPRWTPEVLAADAGRAARSIAAVRRRSSAG
jgi:AcrR family transcriptional regulator